MPIVVGSPRELPSGTVTLVFTDIEGSTRLLHELGPDRYADALAEHRRQLRAAFDGHGGVEVDTQGDAFFYAFRSAQGAVDATREGAQTLANGPIHVRVGIHTGTPRLTAEGYVGPDVHKGARIGAAGHGGQVLLSRETRTLAASRDIAGTYYDAGDKEGARVRHEQSLLQARATGNKEMQVTIMTTLAGYALEDGRVADALEILTASLLMGRELGSRLEIGMILRYMARALALTGKPEVAARILSASEVIREEIGFDRSWFGELDEETLAPIRAQLGQATFDEEWALGRKLRDDHAITLALESTL